MSEQPRRRRRQQIEDATVHKQYDEEKQNILDDDLKHTQSRFDSTPFYAPQWQAHSKQDLLKYLQDAIDQESAIVQQTELISEMDAQYATRKPKLVEEKIDAEPVLERANHSSVWRVACITFFSVMFVMFGGIFCSEMGDLRSLKEEAENGLYSDSYYAREIASQQKSVDGWLIPTVLCGFGTLIPILSYMVEIEENRRLKNAYRKQLEQYKNKTAEVERNNQRLRNIHQSQLTEWSSSAQEARIYMEKPLRRAQELLQAFYAAEIIYPKYRNLPALTSIYEYLITGRCEELTGPHGAYNLYEDELRKDTVISQLNTVIENLEQIRQNQYMLYEQVCAIQQNTAAIRSELAQIKGYTIQIAELSKLNAYYAARTEANTRITMYYHM